MYLLCIKTGRQRGRSWPIEQNSVVIGRDAGCDIVLADQHVSRRQFELVRDGGTLRLVDLGGKNTTLHNGMVASETSVTAGDEISAGQTVFQVLEQRAETIKSTVDATTDTRTISGHEPVISINGLDSEQSTISGHAVEELVHLFQAGRDWSECAAMAGLLQKCEQWMTQLFTPEHLIVMDWDASSCRQEVILNNASTSGELDSDWQEYLCNALTQNSSALYCRRNTSKAVSTILVAPLAIGGAVAGGVLAESSAPGRTYDETDLRLFTSLARAFAPYFRHMMQFESLQGAYEKLRTAEEERSAIVGESDAISEVRAYADSAASHDLPVLILGETGTGKELVAERIHAHSPKRDEPFITANCAAIPKDLFESEFFGHVRGAFTGAVQDRKGRIPEAENGTLFLDEIGELAGENQAKLLRFLESGEYYKIGDPTKRFSRVRVLAASNRDLLEMVALGDFRSDLYYRLCGQVIQIPPLRQRRKDIRLLANHFFERACLGAKRPVRGISREALEYLQGLPWPGNVRELRLAIERAVHIGRGEEISVEDIAAPTAAAFGSTSKVTSGTLEEVTRNHIAAVLEECGGDVDEAAARLAMGRTTLYGKIKQYGLRKA